MSENESKQSPAEDKIEVAVETIEVSPENVEEVIVDKVETTTEKVVTKSKFCNKKIGIYAGAFLIVLLIIGGVLFVMEKQGRSSTHLFTKIIDSFAVAVVNGEKITNGDLKTSVTQFSQMAAAQGVDINADEAKEQINSQALDVLINTELLRQKAAEKGITVSSEEVSERIETIKVDVGGEEVLNGRLTELGISKEKLQQDVNDEILIQRLLDGIFAEKSIEISEEEISKMYNDALAVDEKLPPLENVRADIEKSIKTSKEQVIIDELLIELKDGAQIEIKEE